MMCEICLATEAQNKFINYRGYQFPICQKCSELLIDFEPKNDQDYLDGLMKMRDYVSLLKKMELAKKSKVLRMNYN